VEHCNSFSFMGIFSKTTNNAEMKGEGVIPGMWENFYKNRILELIPNKKDSSILALYSNYESDETGIYTFALGTAVTKSQEIPLGLEKMEVPKGNYVIFTTRKGPMQEVVVEAWQKIWEWSKNHERAFTFDFELYDERAADPMNSQVDIYISIP
jgi:predicted transcriptional regulator YdeE